MKKNYNEIIEQLNKEIINLTSSKEYKLGKNIVEFRKNGLFALLKNIILHIRMKKYNHAAPCENEFTITNTIDLKNKKIVVYGALISNYDSIKEPYLKSEICDYILFTDQKVKNSVWQIRPIPKIVAKLKNPTLINRYIKMHPFEFFSEYDYAIYVDSSIQIVSDLSDFVHRLNLDYGLAFHSHRYRTCIYEEIEACQILKKGNYQMLRRQGNNYMKTGFPYNYGMLECGVIVTDLQNSKSKEILEDWYEEFLNSDSLRDQISLPYVLWKKNIPVKDICTLGNNAYKNSKIRIDMSHK